jgi:hypothetical protein
MDNMDVGVCVFLVELVFLIGWQNVPHSHCRYERYVWTYCGTHRPERFKIYTWTQQISRCCSASPRHDQTCTSTVILWYVDQTLLTPQSVALALEYTGSTGRGICERSPPIPERAARVVGATLAEQLNIVNRLTSHSGFGVHL